MVPVGQSFHRDLEERMWVGMWDARVLLRDMVAKPLRRIHRSDRLDAGTARIRAHGGGAQV
jgi:hypothetical protein